MYYRHFGLQQPPFKITPDTRLFFPGGNRGAVLEALVYAIVNGEGIVKVVGEVGSGKTMLCRMLEKELPEHVDIVYLANPSVAPDQVLYAIAFELKLPVTSADDRLSVMQLLQEYLIKRHADNRRVVVFVEEAQSMPMATLEEIRLLSNLETNQDKLLQIVLFGQPELDETLSKHDIRQLKERITYSFNLPPFAGEDIRDYINSRLRATGFRAGEVFSPRAINAIHRYSMGLVRRINILADKAMLAAFADNASKVLPRHVRTAAADSEFEVPPKWRQPVLAAVCTLLFVVLGALIWFRLHGSAVAPPAPLAASATAVAPAAKSAPEAAKADEAATVPASAPEPDKASPAAAVANVEAMPADGSVTGGVADADKSRSTRSANTEAEGAAAPAAPTAETPAAGEVHVAEENAHAAAAVMPQDPLHQQLMTNAGEEPAVSPLVDIRHIAAPTKSAAAGASP
jgi:type II secretory pathway predicted ATPase ExeA